MKVEQQHLHPTHPQFVYWELWKPPEDEELSEPVSSLVKTLQQIVAYM